MQKRTIGYAIVAIFAFSLIANVYAAELSNSKINSYVLKALESNGEVEVVIYPKEGISRFQFNSLVSSLSNKVIKQFYSENEKLIVARLSLQDIQKVARSLNVRLIEYNFKAKPLLQDSVNIIDAVGAWDKQKNSGGNYMTGDGQTVCVVDTGIDFTHPDLAAKNILGCNIDCTGSSNCPMNCSTTDSDGHGTKVAGIVAASGGINGIGKGANLIGAKVFEDGGETAEMFIIKRAVEWCNANSRTYGISVISISIGTEQLFSSYCDGNSSSLATAIANATARNISVVVATGNEGNTGGIAMPSCISNSIPVAATNKDDTLWQYSNYNWMVKLFAPGSDINTTKLSGEYTNGGAGTSYSTPMVSGSIAILNQYYKEIGKPFTLRPKVDIEPVLFATGDEVSGLSKDSWSRINVNKALTSLDKEAPLVTLNSPIDGSVFYTTGKKDRANVDFNCDAIDWQLESLDLVVKDLSGNEVYRESRTLNGEESTQQSFNLQLNNGLYKWNCETMDMANNLGEAPRDFSLEIAFFPVEEGDFSYKEAININPLP